MSKKRMMFQQMEKPLNKKIKLSRFWLRYFRNLQNKIGTKGIFPKKTTSPHIDDPSPDPQPK